jgi:hypothetical protein
MLKPLLLSGWFRLQPFLKYVVVVMLIAPLVAASGHSTSAKQSQARKVNPLAQESESSVAVEQSAGVESDLAQLLEAVKNDSPATENNDGQPIEAAFAVGTDLSKALQPWTINSLEEDNPATTAEIEIQPAPSIEIATVTPLTFDIKKEESLPPKEDSASKLGLLERIKISRQQDLRNENGSQATEKVAPPNLQAANLQAAKISPIKREIQPVVNEVPANLQAEEAQAAEQQDPIGSPYPIPWKWIQSTHQAMSARGISGVRHHRSLPVISPDGRYAVYSRVQLDVKPELHASRVSSVLFVEDRQTKKLRIVSSTSTNYDPLIKPRINNLQQQDDPNGHGTIGVLVPVSWSEKGERFLARKFEGWLSTSDSTDRAVIWDKQKNNSNTVAPSQAEDEHEKISILLGWSKTQPGHVMFKTGELGDEEWPLVNVSSDGKTVSAADIDQPVTYGQKVTKMWGSEPQVAYR